jgi:arginyl-tRNA--protein-N-Asp/Glu arginylyltransferase
MITLEFLFEFDYEELLQHAIVLKEAALCRKRIVQSVCSEVYKDEIQFLYKWNCPQCESPITYRYAEHDFVAKKNRVAIMGKLDSDCVHRFRWKDESVAKSIIGDARATTVLFFTICGRVFEIELPYVMFGVQN